MKVGDLVKYNVTLWSTLASAKGIGIIIEKTGGTVQHPRYKVMTNGEILHIMVKYLRVIK